MQSQEILAQNLPTFVLAVSKEAIGRGESRAHWRTEKVLLAIHHVSEVADEAHSCHRREGLEQARRCFV